MQELLKHATEAFKETFLAAQSGMFVYSESFPRIYVEPQSSGFVVWHENYPGSKVYAKTIWEAPRVLQEILESKFITLQNDIARLEK